jgi:hypothetical protein
VKVLEIKGFKSLKALNAFHALILGLKMIPQYQALSYEDFLASIELMAPSDQEKIIRQAATFVELQKEEVEAIISFVADDNGVPYGPANIKNLNPLQLVEVIVAVCKEIAAIKIDLIDEDEKKKLKNSQSTRDQFSQETQLLI